MNLGGITSFLYQPEKIRYNKALLSLYVNKIYGKNMYYNYKIHI